MWLDREEVNKIVEVKTKGMKLMLWLSVGAVRFIIPRSRG
jgi:hypothetical protein